MSNTYLNDLEEFGKYWFDEKKSIDRWFKGPNKKFDTFLFHKYNQLYNYIISLHHNTKAFKEIKNNEQYLLYSIILIDQLSRHFYRNDCRAFQQDKKAFLLAKKYINQYEFEFLSVDEFIFLMIVFEHQEDANIHQEALEYINKFIKTINKNDKKNIDKLNQLYNITIEHQKVIEEFGYYPKRKIVCGEKLNNAKIMVACEQAFKIV